MLRANERAFICEIGPNWGHTTLSVPPSKSFALARKENPMAHTPVEGGLSELISPKSPISQVDGTPNYKYQLTISAIHKLHTHNIMNFTAANYKSLRNSTQQAHLSRAESNRAPNIYLTQHSISYEAPSICRIGTTVYQSQIRSYLLMRICCNMSYAMKKLMSLSLIDIHW